MTTLKLTTRAAHAALSIRDFSGHRSSEPGAPGGEPCRCAPADNGNYQHAVSAQVCDCHARDAPFPTFPRMRAPYPRTACGVRHRRLSTRLEPPVSQVTIGARASLNARTGEGSVPVRGIGCWILSSNHNNVPAPPVQNARPAVITPFASPYDGRLRRRELLKYNFNRNQHHPHASGTQHFQEFPFHAHLCTQTPRCPIDCLLDHAPAALPPPQK
jgi:hypothetical protein